MTSPVVGGPTAAPARRNSAGFSLFELIVTVGILGVLTAIAVPQYQQALANSRLAKARQELKLIAIAIDTFKLTRGRLPLTLHEVGYGDRRDPWGTPYCYLNYISGTGDGLQWAIDEGVVDPTALPNSYSDSTWSIPAAPAEETAGGSETESGGSSGSGSGKSGSGKAGSGSSEDVATTLTGAVATTEEQIANREELLEDSKGNAYAYGHIKQAGGSAVTAPELPSADLLTEAGLTAEEAEVTLEKIETTPMFLDIDVPTVRRRNQYMFPLNTDYDLFSLGPNAKSAAALNNPHALDDVIRANNGGYFGTASDY